MIVIGALGFAKELLEVLLENPEEFVFFDDVTQQGEGCIFENYRVLRTLEECRNVFRTDNRFMLGIGRSDLRQQLCAKFEEAGGVLSGIRSERAHIGKYNVIDTTCTVMPGVVIENDNQIGKGTLLHLGAFVSHDVKIGDFCEISPYVKFLGRTSVGNQCSIGTGAIILPRVKIGNNVTVGAGAVVTRDVKDGLTVKGVPAK